MSFFRIWVWITISLTVQYIPFYFITDTPFWWDKKKVTSTNIWSPIGCFTPYANKGVKGPLLVLVYYKKSIWILIDLIIYWILLRLVGCWFCKIMHQAWNYVLVYYFRNYCKKYVGSNWGRNLWVVISNDRLERRRHAQRLTSLTLTFNLALGLMPWPLPSLYKVWWWVDWRSDYTRLTSTRAPRRTDGGFPYSAFASGEYKYTCPARQIICYHINIILL